MDIYSYLEKDHQKVSHLFEQLEKSPSFEHKTALIQLIIKELTIHSKSEEMTFYAALKKFEESKNEINHAQKEHDDIEALIQHIIKAIKEKKNWDKLADKLKDTVEHHVKEEEGQTFKKAKEVLTREEEYALKEQMHYIKGQILNNVEVEC